MRFRFLDVMSEETEGRSFSVREDGHSQLTAAHRTWTTLLYSSTFVYSYISLNPTVFFELPLRFSFSAGCVLTRGDLCIQRLCAPSADDDNALILRRVSILFTLLSYFIPKRQHMFLRLMCSLRLLLLFFNSGIEDRVRVQRIAHI